MSKVIIPFVNDGKPFEVIFTPEEAADYEQKEASLLADKADKHGKLRILQAQRDFITGVLKRSLPDGVKVDAIISPSQIRGAFLALWIKGHEPWKEDPDLPLEKGGEASPPSSSAA